jgi:uncharacterized protein (TIGR03435 family)
MQRAAICVAGLLLCVTPAFGQGAPPKPSFEVASIKPALARAEAVRAGIPGGIAVKGSRATYGGLSLLILVVQAYGVRGYQVIAPSWMNDVRYDIVAKLPDGASPDQAPQMLQSLLEGRFKLTYHRESKEFSVYALIVGKDGPKLIERPPDFDPATKRGPRRYTMTALASRIATGTDRPMLDLTDIKGEYMVDTSELNAAAVQRLMPGLRGGQGSDAATPGGADLGEAAFQLAQRLGLKIEARKMPLPVLVVDHMEKTPSEN